MTAVPATAPSASETLGKREDEVRARLLALATYGVIVLQLILTLAVFHQYDLERSSGFLSLSVLIVSGFAVHAALPLAYRMPFFLALSFGAFTLALGPPAIAIIAGGLVLVGICHLPVAFRVRVVLVAATGVLAAFALKEGIPGVTPGTARRSIAVFASMFMFRIVIYLYDLRNESVKAPVATRLSYFFLLPNAAFPFFPVVDWGAFRRTYYDRPSVEIYQRGARLILRGAIHLLLYRYVYYHLSKAPDAVYGIRTVAIYLASSWLVYLHVSGLFHLVAGVLCLFGFNLPETNRLYLLASSPNDLWRRVNVYWKDFMQKIFYMPAYKALQKRKVSMKAAMLAATAFVFVATWLLHSYQWFWLVGRFPLTWVDVVFWGVFGALVMINTLLQLRRKAPAPRRKAPGWSAAQAAVHVIKVMGMFALMSAMFSWWSTRDPATWIYLMQSVRESSAVALGLFGAGLVAVFAAGVVAHYFTWKGWTLGIGQSVLPFRQSAAITIVGGILLLLLSRPELQAQMGGWGRVMLSLQREKLNARDAAIEDRAYYEAMITTIQPANPVFDVRNGDEADMVPIRNSTAVRYTGDALIYELLPSRSTRNRGADLIANALGMRDKEYLAAKPEGTYRFALIGASVIMASGADQAQSFEALTENRLNAERPGGRYASFEIMNLAVASYGFHQFALVTERKALSYKPDALIVGALAGDHAVTVTSISELVSKRVPLDPELTAILRRAGIGPKAGIVEARRKLKTGNTIGQIRAWSYRRIAELCRREGVIPVFMYLPRLESDDYPPAFEEMSADARAAGMIVLDLRGVYDGVPRSEIIFHPTDVHPNERGHRRIADRLYSAIVAHASELGLTKPTQLQPDSNATND